MGISDRNDSGQGGFEKIKAGATVIQLYTGMIFKDPGEVKNIKKELIEILKKEKINAVALVSSLFNSDNIEETTKHFCKILES